MRAKDYNVFLIENPYRENPTHLPKLTRKQHLEVVEPIRNSKVNPKIDRNSICPKCNSGKKYKKCCGKL
jgi:uncharacterized protein YecA (UPF0149 family)